VGNGAKTGIEKAVVGAVAAVAVLKGVKGAKRREGAGATSEHPANADGNGPKGPNTGRKGDRDAQPRGRDDDAGKSGGVKPVVRKVNDYQRRHPWLGFPMGVAKKFGEDQAGNLAALISYYTFFSLFPLLLALVTILVSCWEVTRSSSGRSSIRRWCSSR
jgi:hypothetical protein